MIKCMKKANNFQTAKAQPQVVVLLIKVLLFKKSVYHANIYLFKLLIEALEKDKK